MKIGRCVFIGIAGCILVLILVWIGGLLSRSDGDLAALTGAILFARDGWAAWAGGFVAQLVLGVVAAIVYAACFEWVTQRAGIWIGLAIGVGHALFAGVALGFVPAERVIAAGLMPPGAFCEYRGPWCIVAVVAAHLVFGGLAGRAYGAPRHAYTRRVWRAATIEDAAPGSALRNL